MWSSDRCYSPAKRSLNVVRIFKESAAPSSPSRFNVEALIGRRRSQATTYSLPPHWTLARKGVSVRFSRIGHTNCVGKPARSGCCNPTKFGRERSAVEEYKDKFIRSHTESPRSTSKSPYKPREYRPPQHPDKKPHAHGATFLSPEAPAQKRILAILLATYPKYQRPVY